MRFYEVNIWEDPDAAAFVRSVAPGNETVPMVRIGSTALVNPSAREVVETARAVAPSIVTGRAGGTPQPRRGRLARLLGGRAEVLRP